MDLLCFSEVRACTSVYAFFQLFRFRQVSDSLRRVSILILVCFLRGLLSPLISFAPPASNRLFFEFLHSLRRSGAMLVTQCFFQCLVDENLYRVFFSRTDCKYSKSSESSDFAGPHAGPRVHYLHLNINTLIFK